jgi:hypothetical protein
MRLDLNVVVRRNALLEDSNERFEVQESLEDIVWVLEATTVDADSGLDSVDTSLAQSFVETVDHILVTVSVIFDE